MLSVIQTAKGAIPASLFFQLFVGTVGEVGFAGSWKALFGVFRNAVFFHRHAGIGVLQIAHCIFWGRSD
tara:strand:+ start:580 stop:786 length:207 start_codon:yes stop_codon:yes gene_type:complete